MNKTINKVKKKGKVSFVAMEALIVSKRDMHSSKIIKKVAKIEKNY